MNAADVPARRACRREDAARRSRAHVLALAVCSVTVVAASEPAAALGNGDVELFAAQSFSRDDNLFRLADDADVEPILGSASRSESYRTTSFGVNFDIPVRGQRLAGDVTFDAQRYRRFSVLSHTARSARVDWIWQAGERFAGLLGYRESLVLGSFDNLQGGIQSKTPNFIDSSETVAELGYELAPRWELRGRLSDESYTNSAPEFAVSDAHIDGRELSISYVARSGNRIGLSIESDAAHLPNEQLVDGVLVDNSYSERTVAMLTDWTITEQSRVNVRLGRVSRSYDGATGRDFDDWMLDVAYEWSPVRHFTLTAGFERDISSSEEINVGFVFVDRYVLRPVLRVTQSIEVAASFERADRTYLGDAGLDSVETGAPVTERTNATGFSVVWTPTRMLRMNLAWRQQRRDAILAFGDYHAEVASLGIRVTF